MLKTEFVPFCKAQLQRCCCYSTNRPCHDLEAILLRRQLRKK